MSKYILFFLFFIARFAAFAQTADDSLFAVRKGESLAIKYTLKTGETMAMVAHRFHITENVLFKANEFDFKKKLLTGDVIYVPVTIDNYYVTKQPFGISGIKELYYHVGFKDDIGLISTTVGITKNEMRE